MLTFLSSLLFLQSARAQTKVLKGTGLTGATSFATPSITLNIEMDVVNISKLQYRLNGTGDLEQQFSAQEAFGFRQVPTNDYPGQ